MEIRNAKNDSRHFRNRRHVINRCGLARVVLTMAHNDVIERLVTTGFMSAEGRELLRQLPQTYEVRQLLEHSERAHAEEASLREQRIAVEQMRHRKQPLSPRELAAKAGKENQ